MKFPGLKPDDIYLPAEGIDLRRWAVVACDQYTSQPDYWRRVEAYVGAHPSTLHIVQPEIDLARAGARIPAIHRAMREYLSNGTLVRAVRNGFTLTERTTASGARLGLVAAVDLEEYDFTPGSGAMVRATEGTIRERIPPRLRIREGAPLECPHVMLLLDDPARTVIEPLHARLRETAPLCDFELMENGGRLRVWGVEGNALAPVSDALSALWERSDGFLYAVGDGNHSLATAKARWDALKPALSPGEAQTHPARYALAEIVNLHSPALAFEPIHRVLFGADMEDLVSAYRAHLASRGMKLTAVEPLSSRASGTKPAEPSSSCACGMKPVEPSSSCACGAKPAEPSSSCACGAKPAEPSSSCACGTKPAEPSSFPASGTKPAEPSSSCACGMKPAEPSSSCASGMKPVEPSSSCVCGAKPAEPSSSCACGTKPAEPCSFPASRTKPAEPSSSRACGTKPAEPSSFPASGMKPAEPSSSACGMTPTDEAELTFVSGNARASYRVGNPENPLPVAVLQPFLDEYLHSHPAARIDYVHGAAAVESLCQTPHTTGVLLPAIDKSALFPAVRQGGALPRKTFSMGEPDEKRYYMECRKIL
ncbi:MAG: DUF1015 family protein [Eubacteriales bacterium]|nr:DUF1015 family protein [Eubacteriales bacterium]